MWGFSGHIGASVSALVDGQLDAESAERAWSHVLTCPACRRLVEREGWVKAQLRSMAGNEPSARLLGSLYGLDDRWAGIEAWSAVDEIERKTKGRRRAGLALVGAGSVSVAVLGFASLGGASLGIGQSPAGTPATSFTRSTTPPTPTAQVTSRPPQTRYGGFTSREDVRMILHRVNE